jgi:hypothetical protein
MAENFDLNRALQILAEDDWVNPTEPFAGNDAELISEKTKEEDPRYWISQVSLMLMQNYKRSSRSVSRVLGIDRDRILRSTKLYEELDPKFKTPDDVVTALREYQKQTVRSVK